MHRLPVRIVSALLFAIGATGLPAAERTIVVAQDGSGAFRTIGAALDSVTNATRESPVTLLIKAGDYEEMLTTRDWVNLVGEDRDKCVIRYSLPAGQTAEVHKYHVLWATSNTEIRNLTLLGGIVKYCIHSDGGGPYTLTVENCTLRRDPANTGGYRSAFGIGLWRDQHIVVRDCLLDSGAPVYMHNGNDQPSSCSMTIERCTLRGDTTAILISAKDSNQRDFFVVHDSTLIGQKAIECLGIEAPDTSRNFVEFYLSGNTATGECVGAVFHDDASERLSGAERVAKYGTHNPPPPGPAGVRLDEDYGTAAGKVKAGAWVPVKSPGQHGLAMEVAEDALVLTCPPVQDNPGDFGYAQGPQGAQLGLPFAMDLRLKTALVPNGQMILYICRAPDAWCLTWLPDKVQDGNKPDAAIPVDTAAMHTCRVVARSPADVRLFVEGGPGEGIKLTASAHTAVYTQLRLYGHGSRAEIDRLLLTGDLPAEGK